MSQLGVYRVTRSKIGQIFRWKKVARICAFLTHLTPLSGSSPLRDGFARCPQIRRGYALESGLVEDFPEPPVAVATILTAA